QAGFTNVVTDQEFSPDIAEGFTTRTDPEAGRVVGRDDTITVWVSEGPEPTTVPNLEGKTVGEANTAAEAANLVLVENGTSEVTAASGLEGRVATQDPGAGETVDSGTEVRVTIGVLKQVTVRDFTGMTAAEAATAGANDGLDVVVAGPAPLQPGDPNIGLVAAQDPPQGTTVNDGSQVAVFIGEIEQVTVPDVVGRTEADATAAINAAGLVATKTGVASDTVPDGIVVSQNPGKDATVDKGSTVDLVVSTGPPPTTTTAAP
ncbi:MAG: PASTA domain-containing protein, partial [Actinomycetia bacterium]|nr:PASTA domain-containing protein [Actinomycetes bacterium]